MRCLEPLIKHEAGVVKMKTIEIYSVLHFGIFHLICSHTHNLLYFAISSRTMYEAGASRFRGPKTAEEEQIVVYKAIPPSTKYKKQMCNIRTNGKLLGQFKLPF